MAYELFYTSAPKGLRPQTSGICTVGMTRGFPAPFISRVEALSGYRPPFEGAPLADCPTAYSHWIIEAAGVTRHILAAVRATKPDHTLRSNKLAHYLLLRQGEQPKIGPAWLLSQPSVMSSEWFGEPREFEVEKTLPENKATDCVRCDAWEKLTGDAGWAGVIANAAMLNSKTPCSIVYPKGTQVLELVHEALLLIPQEWRWRVTFTTYFMEPFAGLRCAWRFCMDGTPAASAARQSPGLTIDLCTRAKCTRSGQFIDAARTGKNPVLLRDRFGSSESELPQELSSDFRSDDLLTVSRMEIKNGTSSVSGQTRKVDFGFRANRERQSKIVIFAAGFSLAAILALIFIFVLQRGVTGSFESPLVNQPSGILEPSAPPKVIVPSEAGVTSDEIVKLAVAAEGLRLEQINLDTKRRIDEVLARNKIFQEKLEGVEKELAAAKALTTVIAPTPTTPAVSPTLPTQASDWASSMPTKTSDWKLFKLPKPTRNQFGSFEGTAKLEVEAKINSVAWFPIKTTGTKTKTRFEFSESEHKVFLQFNGRREEVVSVDVDESYVSFSWVASAATIQSNPTLVKDLQEDLRGTALTVRIDRGFEWYIFDAIPKIRLDPNLERDISLFSTSSPFHYSFDGKPWVDFENGVVDIDIPAENEQSGSLKFKPSKTGEFLSVEFRFPANFDKDTLLKCIAAVKKAKEELKSAQVEFDKFEGVLSRNGQSEMMQLRKEAKVALETAKVTLEDAEKEESDKKELQSNFLSYIETTRVLVGPANGVPIAELQFKNTRPQQKPE